MCQRRFDIGRSLSLGNSAKSVSVPMRGATRFPLGLIGKMSDMLKVALGFMQSQ